MATNIQWTEETWNPLSGCTLASPGCTNCYAQPIAYRMSFNPATPHYRRLTRKVDGQAVWTGEIARAPDGKLYEPLGWKNPRMVFVNSMSDLFYERFPDKWIDDVFRVMELRPQHTYQILTKRHERMRDYMQRYCGDREPLRQCWLGVSVEDQRRADERLPLLLDTPAAVRFVSVEPLLEPVGLRPWLHGLNWIIVGGESGNTARPFDLAWARDILAQCRDAGVRCFVKQMGSTPIVDGRPLRLEDPKAEIRRNGRSIFACVSGQRSIGRKRRDGRRNRNQRSIMEAAHPD